MKPLRKPIFPVIGIGILIALAGYMTGRLVAVHKAFPPIAVIQQPDKRPPVATIRIDGIENGMLRGRIIGDGRFFLGENQILPNASGAFLTAAYPVLTETVTVAVPEGMAFVASVRGAKYYPIASSQGQQIVPENRVYFRTAEEAEDAGYVR